MSTVTALAFAIGALVELNPERILGTPQDPYTPYPVMRVVGQDGDRVLIVDATGVDPIVYRHLGSPLDLRVVFNGAPFAEWLKGYAGELQNATIDWLGGTDENTLYRTFAYYPIPHETPNELRAWISATIRLLDVNIELHNNLRCDITDAVQQVSIAHQKCTNLVDRQTPLSKWANAHAATLENSYNDITFIDGEMCEVLSDIHDLQAILRDAGKLIDEGRLPIDHNGILAMATKATTGATQ